MRLEVIVNTDGKLLHLLKPLDEVNNFTCRLTAIYKYAPFLQTFNSNEADLTWISY